MSNGIAASVRLAIRRSAGRPGLVAIRFFGVLVAVTLVIGVSLYSTAMGDAMLQARLRDDPASANIALNVAGGPLTGASYAALDSYIRTRASPDLGLPLHGTIVQHRTATVSLYRVRPGATALAGQALGSVAMEYDEALPDHATLVTGSRDPPAGPGGAAGVLLSRDAARALRLRVGDRIAFSGDGTTPLRPTLVLAGVFVPIDPGGDYWSGNSAGSAYNALVTTHLETFQRFASLPHLFLPDYFWLQRTSLQAVHLADADAILHHLTRLRSRTSALAPGAQILTSLDMGINGFLLQYSLLSSILLILAGPILALILYAVVVTTALALQRQSGEILLERSRGASRAQVFAMYTIEGIVFAVVALIIGPPFGVILAGLIAHASGFLTFGGGLPVHLRLTTQTFLLAGGTALLCLIIGLLPAWALSCRPLLAFRGEQARTGMRPLWQRLFLDLVMLAVALYGLIVLRQQGPVTTGAATSAVARDPLIAIAPLLFAVAVTLLIGRALPWLAGAGVRLLAAVASPAVHLALQGMARAPRQPMRLVQLCTLTLTLGIFAATVAAVESRNQADQQAYEAGATVRLVELAAHSPGISGGLQDSMPLADHLRLPGVYAATPALRYESVGNITNTTGDGTTINVLGIDPRTIGRVIWFRADFATLSLDRLLGSLTRPGPNAIVSDTFLHATGLHPGDSFSVTLTNNRTIGARVAGVARYFPTLDPRAVPFVITNLDYLRRASQGHGPNEVWMSADPNPAIVGRIVAAARAWPRQIIDYEGSAPTGEVGQDPLRVGIYGVVSVGFLIAVALALLGFLAYAYLSMQQRLAEFAIVRALGLSSGGMRALLLYEHAFLLGAAMLGGIVAGVITTQLYLPYLPIATHTLPPFLVVTPWGAVEAFVLIMLGMFLLVLGIYSTLALRMQLGRVLRLGDG